MPTDPTAPRHNGNPESAAAFEQSSSGHCVIKERILEVITAQGDHGITADELAARWNVGVNTISGRFSQLAAEKKIKRQGTRPTRTGCQAAIWILESEQLAFAL